MTTDESRACLRGAEALLRETAEQLIAFPLDPGCLCAALERAKHSLEAFRRNSHAGCREFADISHSVGREAARVQRLLEGAAVLSFRCFSGAATGDASYTAAGEVQSAPQAGRLVFQA